MSTMTHYEVVVFGQDGTGVPVRVFSQRSLESYLRFVLRKSDTAREQGCEDLADVKEALRGIDHTITVRKVKVDLEEEML